LFTDIYYYYPLTTPHFRREIRRYALYDSMVRGRPARSGGFQTLLTIPTQSGAEFPPRSIGMRHPIKSIVLTILTLCASAGAAMAAAGGAMTVELNESRRIPLTGTAATVVVGDPSVADVSMVDSHSVILLGRGFGATQLVVTDRDGRTLLAGTVSVVSPDRGRVTLTRGVESTEYGCFGDRCHPLTAPRRSNGGSAGLGASPASAAPVGGGEAQAAAAAPPVVPLP
jgi:hypothetical protein